MLRLVRWGFTSSSDTPAVRATLTPHSKGLFEIVFRHFWLILMRSFLAACNRSLR